MPRPQDPPQPTAQPHQPPPPERPSWLHAPILQPVPLAALMILGAVILLIAATVLGLDRGNVLQNLQNGLYARGLITYLFAVGTIGGVVVLILAALISPGGDTAKENFARAKEVLSLLLGIFGTIIGFYFGSIKSEQEGPVGSGGPVQIAVPPSADTIGGGMVPVMAFIRGGAPPYAYGLGLDEDAAATASRSSPDGWIRDSLPAPAISKDTSLTVYITARDRGAGVTTSQATVFVRAAAPAVPAGPAAPPADSAGG
ncbi:MAG TPA: hypothetical protein VE871_02605 [Longimicrobium sp.]|nr:hypothetical protein [Longimicrobium sp.]